MLNIVIKTIPHSSHRYETVGDYWIEKDGTVQVRVSDLGDPYMEACVVIHELAEFFAIRKDGIPVELIDLFDKDYEARRKPGDFSEPGDSPSAPYRQHHFMATTIERILAQFLGIDWKKYEETIDSLDYPAVPSPS